MIRMIVVLPLWLFLQFDFPEFSTVRCDHGPMVGSANRLKHIKRVRK